MIVRKLRAKKSWSQEQLADFCGLNVRTIQRVESGQKASIETLKCIASVFEVDISTLTKEIIVIDKKSETWKQLPWWFRFNMFGLGTRRQVFIIELGLFASVIVSCIADRNPIFTFALIVSLYSTVWLIRYGDNKDVWSL